MWLNSSVLFYVLGKRVIVLGNTVINRYGLICKVKCIGKVRTCCCGGQGDGEWQRGTMCTVRRELFDLFLQVVCRRGQWQAEERGFSPANCSGMS